jgi:hypothetical protein
MAGRDEISDAKHAALLRLLERVKEVDGQEIDRWAAPWPESAAGPRTAS